MNEELPFESSSPPTITFQSRLNLATILILAMVQASLLSTPSPASPVTKTASVTLQKGYLHFAPGNSFAQTLQSI